MSSRTHTTTSYSNAYNAALFSERAALLQSVLEALTQIEINVTLNDYSAASSTRSSMNICDLFFRDDGSDSSSGSSNATVELRACDETGNVHPDVIIEVNMEINMDSAPLPQSPPHSRSETPMPCPASPETREAATTPTPEVTLTKNSQSTDVDEPHRVSNCFHSELAFCHLQTRCYTTFRAYDAPMVDLFTSFPLDYRQDLKDSTASASQAL
jgi:hypothetical protein